MGFQLNIFFHYSAYILFKPKLLFLLLLRVVFFTSFSMNMTTIMMVLCFLVITCHSRGRHRSSGHRINWAKVEEYRRQEKNNQLERESNYKVELKETQQRYPNIIEIRGASQENAYGTYGTNGKCADNEDRSTHAFISTKYVYSLKTCVTVCKVMDNNACIGISYEAMTKECRVHSETKPLFSLNGGNWKVRDFLRGKKGDLKITRRKRWENKYDNHWHCIQIVQNNDIIII